MKKPKMYDPETPENIKRQKQIYKLMREKVVPIGVRDCEKFRRWITTLMSQNDSEVKMGYVAVVFPVTNGIMWEKGFLFLDESGENSND